MCPPTHLFLFLFLVSNLSSFPRSTSVIPATSLLSSFPSRPSVIPATSLFRHCCAKHGNLSRHSHNSHLVIPEPARKSVSTWYTQPLSECILRHITRPRWHPLHTHLGHPTLSREHSKAHYPLQVALASYPPGTPNPCKSAFWGTSPAPGGTRFLPTWSTQSLLESVLRHITRPRWQQQIAGFASNDDPSLVIPELASGIFPHLL